MTVSTYYYPAANGGGEIVPGGPAQGGSPNYSGTASFQVQFQSTAGSYIKVVYDTSNPTQTVVTFNYGTSNPVTETLQITPYGSANQIETSDGTYNYILSNTPVAVGQTYTLTNGGSSQFAFNPAFTGNPVCFAAGTKIRTPNGDIAIEHLKIGDKLVTFDRDCSSIRWLGHRTIECRRHPSPHEIMPIRISADAFGEGRPGRDLRVSPGHAICVDAVGEVLIAAAALVNGTTIVQEEIETITYWHVELEGGHNIVLAENLPCESYIEMGNRSFFAEADATALHASPDGHLVTHEEFCRPFQQDGAVVEFVRERLSTRSRRLGWALQEVPLANLYLLVDGQRLEAEISDLSARFHVPANAKDVWLISDTGVPAEIGATADLRTLGVCIGSLVIDDGFGKSSSVSADHPLLSVGFHDVEEGPQRWTAGRSRLPAELWTNCRSSFFLRVDLTRPALPRWLAPNADVPERLIRLVG